MIYKSFSEEIIIRIYIELILPLNKNYHLNVNLKLDKNQNFFPVNKDPIENRTFALLSSSIGFLLSQMIRNYRQNFYNAHGLEDAQLGLSKYLTYR